MKRIVGRWKLFQSTCNKFAGKEGILTRLGFHFLQGTMEEFLIRYGKLILEYTKRNQTHSHQTL